VALIFVLKARRVVEVRVQDVWANHDTPRYLDANGLTRTGAAS
jgi:hypothetical protein